MITDGIYQLLKQEVPLTGGWHPVKLPEKAMFPAGTYHIVGGSSSPTFETSGMQRLRAQFDVFSEAQGVATYREATRARDALRQILNGFQGQLPNGEFVQNAELIQSVDQYESDPRQFRCMSEYYFFFTFPN